MGGDIWTLTAFNESSKTLDTVGNTTQYHVRTVATATPYYKTLQQLVPAPQELGSHGPSAMTSTRHVTQGSDTRRFVS